MRRAQGANPQIREHAAQLCLEPAQPIGTSFKIFNMSLLRAVHRHVDASRLGLRAILSSVLDRVQREIPEMLVEPGVSPDQLAITVGKRREIVAAAFADLDRALLVGERTFGSGTIEELYDNDDGSKLRLTTAYWLMPSGRSLQAVGLVPDIALRSVSIPAQNHDPGDEVRLLAPSRAVGEVALAGHLTSTLAADAQPPAFEI